MWAPLAAGWWSVKSSMRRWKRCANRRRRCFTVAWRTGSDAVGSDCGGAMSVYISVHGLRPRLLLVGAGHVNRAVAHAAARVDFDICVGDIYSASLCPDAFPLSARLVHAASFTDVVEAMAVGRRISC